ncbi:beta-lactamase-like protein [Globomyces pollinis-pini]|nr:beta-lactamase-like protein [Globomyces pollinis-pini]KAJ2999412.1 hypothetical protein HDV02_003030 [Globomyces sp. JEL0801]
MSHYFVYSEILKKVLQLLYMPTDIQITFLGTASAQPSLTRNQSSLALRFDGTVWLFDAGEGTQHRLIQNRDPSNNIKLGKIRRIFITHLHGDHSFGLPGLLCTLSQNVTIQDGYQDASVDIYGPPGTRRYVRNSLLSTYCRLGVKYSVHELVYPNSDLHLTDELHPEEILGLNIPQSVDSITSNLYWDVFRDEETSVIAASIKHTVPCLGYVVTEANSPGKLRANEIIPILKSHSKEFQEQGIRNPLALLSSFKNGNSITLPNGQILNPADYMDPERRGRKLVILGDTSDPSNIQPFCNDATVLIHEATNSFLKSDSLDTTEQQVHEQTISHGHSTPQMAGQFAKAINAKQLLLNHFSARYKGDQSPESVLVMDEIANLAKSAFGTDNVLTAYDYLTVTVPRVQL